MVDLSVDVRFGGRATQYSSANPEWPRSGWAGPLFRARLCLGAVPIGLQRVQAVLQDVVHFGHAILDQLELVVGVGDLALRATCCGR
jgi:hypothetical protein